MRLLSLIAFVGMLTLILSGCGSEGTASNTTAATKTEVKPPVIQPTASNQQLAQKPVPETVVNESTAAQNSQTQTSQNQSPPSTAGLIQPTNVNQRTKQVLTGRADPFAGLFAIPKVPVAATPKKVVPSLPRPATPRPQVVQPVKPAIPLPPPTPVIPPPPPQPELARGVVVLGIVEIGSELQAIVQVPNEATSRYVSEGQRLLDGQVLVKRIEINSGSEPTVLLEQNGIEVTRAVGEEPAQPEQNQPRPTATIPVSSPLPGSLASTREPKIKLQPQQSTFAIPVPQLPPSSPQSVAELKSMLQVDETSDTAVLPPPPTANPSSAEKLIGRLKEEELKRRLKID